MEPGRASSLIVEIQEVPGNKLVRNCYMKSDEILKEKEFLKSKSEKNPFQKKHQLSDHSPLDLSHLDQRLEH